MVEKRVRLEDESGDNGFSEFSETCQKQRKLGSFGGRQKLVEVSVSLLTEALNGKIRIWKFGST